MVGPADEKVKRRRDAAGRFVPQTYATPTGLPPAPSAPERSDEDKAYDAIWSPAREPVYARAGESQKLSPEELDRVLGKLGKVMAAQKR